MIKEKYIKPIIVNNVRDNGVFPAGLAAFLAGYAVARAVANEMKASPVQKLQSLQTIGVQ